MANFYKIPKGLAEQVGQIEFLPGKAIDLTVCKLKNNKYALDEETIDFIKANGAEILNHVPANMRNRIREIIDFNKADHDKATHQEIQNDLA